MIMGRSQLEDIGTRNARMVFTHEKEEDLANHIKYLADSFYGLSTSLAYAIFLLFFLRRVQAISEEKSPRPPL